MLRLDFGKGDVGLRRFLCLGAHSDDIEIGCGGSVLRLLRENENVEALWVVFSADDQRAIEARSSAAQFLSRAKKKEVRVEGFRDGFFPYEGNRIKEYFERLKKEFDPDLIFTHFRDDFHQDHRLVSELTWNTFRTHFILEYEVIKYDGDLGRPNVYFPLDEDVCNEKIGILLESFKSQAKKSWFTADAFRSIMRLRGIEINAKGNHAEAFYGRKVCL
jgi:LmbE family N-acetylglucosaminyl deacetylase